MISAADLQVIALATYAVAFLVLLLRLRAISPAQRRYCYPMLGVIGLAAIAMVLDLAAVGRIAVGESSISVPTVAEGAIAYAVVWGTCGWLADVDRRLLVPIVAIPTGQVVVFYVASALGPTTAVLGAGFVIAGYVVTAYLMLGPVWSAARDLPRARRLLHWKCRNLLLFLIGVLILFATIAVTVTLSTFVATVLGLYIEMIVRIGIAGFLFANVSALEDVADAGRDLAEGSQRPAGSVGG